MGGLLHLVQRAGCGPDLSRWVPVDGGRPTAPTPPLGYGPENGYDNATRYVRNSKILV